MKIFYAAGPGNVIQAHEYWKKGEQNPTEVSITFSGQFQDFCRSVNAKAYIVSYHPERKKIRDGDFILEHRPKQHLNATGIMFHLGEIWYGIKLLFSAVRFRTKIAVVDSGTTHSFMLFLWALLGIKIVPVLHNSLWPAGFPPTQSVQKLVLWLDSWFWRWIPVATLCVSPECKRQVVQATGGKHRPLYEMYAQFKPEYFATIPSPPSHDRRPFRIMYTGRVEACKGVFDIVTIAEALDVEFPGQLKWTICGRGAALPKLREMIAEKGLESVIDLPGWVTLEQLAEIYGRSHAAVVPTRSSFLEGLAMTAVEHTLAGRPVVTSPVVPALEVLAAACVEAETNKPDTFREAIRQLFTDQTLYEKKQRACAGLHARFIDGTQGLTAVLGRALEPWTRPRSASSVWRDRRAHVVREKG